MGPWSFSNRMDFLFCTLQQPQRQQQANECVIYTQTKYGEATLYPEYPLLIGIMRFNVK